jgi:hypothetical protein
LRLLSDDRRVLAAVVRVPRTVQEVAGLTDKALHDVLPGLATTLVIEKANREPAWVHDHLGEDDVPITISDSAALKAAPTEDHH